MTVSLACNSFWNPVLPTGEITPGPELLRDAIQTQGCWGCTRHLTPGQESTRASVPFSAPGFSPGPAFKPYVITCSFNRCVDLFPVDS